MLLVTKHGFIRTRPKVNNNPLLRCAKINKIVHSLSAESVIVAYFLGFFGDVITLIIENRITVNAN